LRIPHLRENPLLSIVITSYDIKRLKDIKELLDSIKHQTYQNLEVIIVIEGSKELYEEVKKDMEKIVLGTFNVQFIAKGSGACAARNLGIEDAKGDIIAFVDDDAIVFPNWAEDIIKTYQDDSIIGVTGPSIPLWVRDSIYYIPKQFSWVINCTEWLDCKEVKDVRNIWATNAAFRREAFVYERFRESLGPVGGGIEGWKKGLPEEVELSYRIRKRTGKRIVYNPRVMVKHKVYPYKINSKYIVRHAFFMGFSRFLVRKLFAGFSNSDPLYEEKILLNSIFKELPLMILNQVFKNPIIGVKMFLTSLLILFSLTLGYLSGYIKCYRVRIQV
jgi:glycosyltransferase involved in cell wall biosynthesis